MIIDSYILANDDFIFESFYIFCSKKKKVRKMASVYERYFLVPSMCFSNGSPSLLILL